ncbi:MAG TPA: oxidoreductase [Myxococcota bacterium]|nr:oxidoreductase [Myxococcota bacterium]
MTNRVSHAVLITGCSTGIGRATATHLAQRGHTVYATARRPEAIEDLAHQGCRVLALDVCDEGSIRTAVEAVEKSEGAVGVLVNNAGYGSEGPFEEVPMEEVRRQFETNVFGLIQLTKLVLPGMRRQRSGRIVNLSSMGGRMTLPGGAFYHATKYAVEALSDALRFEVSGFGIAVVLIEPGPIKTEFGATALAKVRTLGAADSPYAKFREVLARHLDYTGPIGALAGTPEAVAKVIERAIAARRPRPRYPVTLAARGFMGARRWLGARGFDAVLRTQFPTPGR